MLHVGGHTHVTNFIHNTPSTRHSHLVHITPYHTAPFKCSQMCDAYRAHRHGSRSPYPGSTPGLTTNFTPSVSQSVIPRCAFSLCRRRLLPPPTLGCCRRLQSRAPHPRPAASARVGGCPSSPEYRPCEQLNTHVNSCAQRVRRSIGRRFKCACQCSGHKRAQRGKMKMRSRL